jgi:multidrug efflux pump subunit AcrB
MWIVKVALQRPYTFIMLAVLIVLMGTYAVLNTATDIFPNIKIPIAAVIWRYNGILPEEIANRIVLFSERAAQTTVNEVEHTESQSVNGTAVVKYFFQPDVDPDLSLSQLTAISQTELAYSPPGTTPVHPVIQCFERTHPAIGVVEFDSFRSATLRCGEHDSAHPACHGGWRVDSLPLWREAASGPSGS